MSVTSVHTDYDDLSITLIVDFEAPIERVWELWSDPRKLERWWAPPDYPATFERHDLTPGGEVTYSMTGPDGDAHHGMWRVEAVDPPVSLQFTDVFADPQGMPVADMPASTIRVELTERDGGTRMEMRLKFDSREDMQKVVDMGTIEVFRRAFVHMDAELT